MRKLIYIFSFLSLLGCSKDWLELDQPGNIDKPYFVDGETAYEAVIAAYDVQAWRNNLVSLWAVGSVMSDDAVKGGESNGDQQGMYDMMNFNATPQTDVPHWIWDDMYRLIARSNFAVDILIEEDVDGNKVLEMAIVNRGLYDHLDGGFFRYCVDREWHIHHYEKMLYDNAQLISLLSRYDLIHPNKKYKNPVFDTISFLCKYFYTSLFASSIDADNVEGEGKYYTFSQQEISDNFSKVEQEYFQSYFISSVNKPWEDRWHLHGDVNQVSKEKKKIKQKLSGIRATHPSPAIDFKQICSWNSRMVIALVDAAIAYKNEQWAKQAEIVLQKMTTIFLDDTTIYRVVYNHNKKEGCLEDYAWFIAAMIKMGSIHCSGHYFEKAINLVESVINDFFDHEKKLFRYSNEQNLYKVKFEVEDQVIPSSNSIMAQNLLTLYEVTRTEKYQELAIQMFDVVAEKAKKWLPNYSNWMHVKRKFDHSNPKIVMCHVDFPTICDLIQQKKSLDFTYVLEKEVSITLFKGKYNSKNRNIFVCGDQYCFEPVKSIKDAIKLCDEVI